MRKNTFISGIFVFVQVLLLSAAGIVPALSSPGQNPPGGQAAKPSIGDALHKIILEKDVAAAIGEYRQLKAGSPDA